MSSINTFKTFQYVQPDEYHFSHDSVFLARKVFEIIRDKNLAFQNILDLCAGCGIVGLDLCFHLMKELNSTPNQLDFLEVQHVYKKYLTQNIQGLKENFNFSYSTSMYFENYESKAFRLKNRNAYDLIVSNPPYFNPTQGKLSPSEFKNRCRFYIDSSFSNLLLSIQEVLKPGGSAFILVKPLENHKLSWTSEFKNHPMLSCHFDSKIRSTELYHITKT